MYVYMLFAPQLEQVDPAAVEQAKHQDPHVDNLVAVGDIVYIKQSRPVNFQQQVGATTHIKPSDQSQVEVVRYQTMK